MGLLSGASGPTGLFGRYRELMGGAADPRLSQQANDTAQRNAMVHAGLTMAAGPGGQGLIPAMARGALAGREHGAAQREQQYMQTQEQRIAQALQDPQLLAQLSPQQQAMIRMMPPMQAMEALQELLKPDTKVVGDALVDQFGRPVYQTPFDASKGLSSDVYSAAALLGIDPRNVLNMTPEQQAAVTNAARGLRESGATRLNVSTNMPQERTRNGLIDYAVGDYGRVQERAIAAGDMLANLNLVGNLVDQGLRTGRWEEATMPLREMAAGLGVKVSDQLEGQQLLRAIGQDMTLLQTAKLKGAISDKELQFLKETMPGLHLRPGGNQMLVTVLRRMAERDIALASMSNDYINENNGVLDHNWIQHRLKWAKENALFTPREVELLRAGTSAKAPWER
jgi:hypothetical protein